MVDDAACRDPHAARPRLDDRTVGDRHRPRAPSSAAPRRRRQIGLPQAGLVGKPIRRRRSIAVPAHRRAGPRMGSPARNGRAGPRSWLACRRRSACASWPPDRRRMGRRSRRTRRCRRPPRRGRPGSACRPRPGTPPRANLLGDKSGHHPGGAIILSRPQVDKAGDLLGRGDPRFRSRPGHPAGPTAVHARRGHEHPARADHRHRSADADVLSLVDRAPDRKLAGIGRRHVDCVHESWRSVCRLA